MIGDTIGITYNAVAKTLVKVNQDNFGADYYYDDSANLMRFFLKIRHTIPARGKSGESHLLRLDVEVYDAGGVLLRTSSAWNVISTGDGVQDFTTSKRVQAALLTAATVTNTDKLLGRES
nr:MAG: hypothetical protein 2 [Leviviridae sp.]